MSVFDLIVLAVALSMDAFAVSVCKGLATRKLSFRNMLICGVWFGGFQALMPSVGYLLGSAFERYITAFDHWIAFVLLGLIGINMVRESFSKEEEEVDASYGLKSMLVMAVATSIDALAAGITFSSLHVNIFAAAGFIGVTTFLFSAAGVKIGNVFGAKYKNIAERVGGFVLIALGIKILMEHLL